MVLLATDRTKPKSTCRVGLSSAGWGDPRFPQSGFYSWWPSAFDFGFGCFVCFDGMADAVYGTQDVVTQFLKASSPLWPDFCCVWWCFLRFFFFGGFCWFVCFTQGPISSAYELLLN